MIKIEQQLSARLSNEISIANFANFLIAAAAILIKFELPIYAESSLQIEH